jgi:hypothetical protein
LAIPSILLNLLLPGFGTALTAFYGPKGVDILCLTVGVFQTVLYYSFIILGIITFGIGGLPIGLVFAIFVHAWCLVHSYFVLKLQKEKK